MNRLKELRQEKKLSQKEIALELQVPPRTYQRWENGESQIKPDKAQQLADYFGVSVGHLLGYISDEIYNTFKNSLEPLANFFKEREQYQKELEEYALNHDLRDKIHTLIHSDFSLEHIRDLNDLRFMIETRFNNKLLTEPERETLERLNLELSAFIDELYRFRLFLEDLPNE